MERNKKHFRHLLLYCFNLRKQLPNLRFISKTYFWVRSINKKRKYWFQRFKNDDFDLKNKEQINQKNSKMPNCRNCWKFSSNSA